MDLRSFYGGAPDQHSLIAGGPHARAIAQLFWIYVALLSLVAVLVIGSVALAIWRRRARTGPLEAPALSASELDPGEPAVPLRRLDAALEARRRRKVIISSAATLLALFVLLAESVGTSNALEALSGGEQLEIQVTGKQWWWQVRYLDPSAVNGFSTANELHIPVGRSVRLQLSAADVIHSFWAPSLNGKRDLIPGHDNQLVLKADRPGRYRAQCAEFCGGAHAQMALWIVAEPASDFAAWCAQQRLGAAEPATDLAREGRTVFLRAQCPSCHAIGGTDAQSQIGPDLTHFASRLGLAAASFPNRRGYLAGWIVGAQGMKPASHMPNLMLEPHELQALLAFLEGLR
jgi:cytochrome c oxidase subunit 2